MIEVKKNIEDEIVRLFAEFSQMHLPVLLDELNKWHPPVDVFETEDKLVIMVEIAGIDIGDITLTQSEDIITIQGVRKENFVGQAPIFHHMEINYGPFERNIKIPPHFVGGKISAKYKNGFLTIEIEKVSEPVKEITIE